MAKTATSKKATTGVAVVEAKPLFVPKTAQDVPKIIEALKEQLKSLKGNVEDAVSTDVSFDGVNIKNVKTVNELLQISALAHAQEEAYNKEVVRYGLENSNLKTFSIEEKSVAHWEKVISKAIFELTNNVKIKKIENAIAEFSKHLDAETRLQNTFENLMVTVNEPLA
jgi:hypothetical protein